MYRALIIGNYRFPASRGSLSELQGPKRDGMYLRDALTDHGTGMFDRADVRILNDEASSEVYEAVDDLFQEAEPDDTLLFYYSGHGLTLNQQLFLCTQNTRPDRLHSTAVYGPLLSEMVSGSLAQAKILVLDCCYSAAFKGSVLAEELSGTGRYVIAATSASERAGDSRFKGVPSPFTKALADALVSEAVDRDGDGKVDLDDVYDYLERVPFDGSRPHRKFDGAGAVRIANRLAARPRGVADAPPQADAVTITVNGLAEYGTRAPSGLEPSGPQLPYLDTVTAGTSFSPARVAEFRRLMRSDARTRMPDDLTAAEFLARASLMRNGAITYAGVLLFGENPTSVLPSAVVQCVRFHGTTASAASLESTDLHDTVPELIVQAREFIAGIARIGEAPTAEGAYAEPAYRYPMVAVREIVANAVVHRDYEHQESSVQIHAFDDRLEVHSPGAWWGATVEPGVYRLSELARKSQRRNFRLAQTLTWSRLVEGVGTGVARAVEECEAVDAREPSVEITRDAVTVTIFPRSTVLAKTDRTYIWGPEIPFRNPHFTGREVEIQALREQLRAGSTAVIRQPPSALYGLGGVGKTGIATEYAHRYAREYEVVWWINADQEDTIQASLVALGRQLRLLEASPGDRDQSLRLVLDALQSGEPYSRWLLIFDNVTEPESLRRYIPQGGHVIITSRISEWRQTLSTEGIEVREFTRADTVRFLRDRVPELYAYPDASPEAEASAVGEADRLAGVLGDLPLAAEHAASYLEQTGVSVGVYIAQFEGDAHNMLSQGADMFSANMAVATTWSLTRLSLTPESRELFQLLAFFAAEPIYEDLLLQPQLDRVALDPALPEPLQTVLSSRAVLKRAQRELARFSLVTLHGQQNLVQMHRVVQAVTRARIETEAPELAAALRETVFALLAGTDPAAPELEQNDPVYDRTIQHLVPTGALESGKPLLRSLIINQVRRLRMRGGNSEALSLGEPALAIWKAEPNNIQTLEMAVEVAAARRDLGQLEEAFALNADTLQRLREHHGHDDHTYLICASSYGEDLRLAGRYDDALAGDLDLLPAYERAFRPGHFRSLDLRRAIAADLRCVGRYADALAYDTHVATELERAFGTPNRQTTAAGLGRAQDLRYLGRYEEALEASRAVTDLLAARDEPWNLPRLEALSELAACLRQAGHHNEEASNLAEDVFLRCTLYAGKGHRATLRMATNLVCDRRHCGDLHGSKALGEDIVHAWEKAAGILHPNTLATNANLAVTLRLLGDATGAHTIDRAVLTGMRGGYRDNHPDILAVTTNLASDLAALGDTGRAIELGEQAVKASKEILGPDHPITLAALANLATDMLSTGDEHSARALATEAMAGLDARLSPEHPHAVAARQGTRIDIDVIPASR